MEKNYFENLLDLLNRECILNIFLPDCIAFAEKATLYHFSYTLLIIIVTFFYPFQTLNTISAEKNSTIVFPLPIDMLTYFMKAAAGKDS